MASQAQEGSHRLSIRQQGAYIVGVPLLHQLGGPNRRTISQRGSQPLEYRKPAAFGFDVAMKEDTCPSSQGNAAEVFATAWHMALNML